MYRVPPRAFSSKKDCIMNACLSALIVTAVACVKSAVAEVSNSPD